MRTRRLIVAAMAALCLAAAGCSEEEVDKGEESSATEESANPVESPGEESGGTASTKPRPKPKVDKPTGTPPSKLETDDLIDGTGATARSGDQIRVNYVGVSFKTGKEFDSSFRAGQPFEFQLGGGMVIPGWDQGIEGMRVGGRRKLVIPPDLAYGAEGSPPAIGPNETLVFVVDLLATQ